MAGRQEEALVRRIGLLGGEHVCESQVAHVDPEEDAAGRERVLLLALDDVADALVGGVEGFEGGEVVDDGAEDEGGTALWESW